MKTIQIVPVSDMHTSQSAVLAKLENGPVCLTQRSKAAAMLISPQEWNSIIDQLDRVEELEDLVEALTGMLQVERGEMTLEDATITELEAWAGRVPA